MYVGKVITFILARSQSVRLHALEIGEVMVYMLKRYSDHWLKHVASVSLGGAALLFQLLGIMTPLLELHQETETETPYLEGDG